MISVDSITWMVVIQEKLLKNGIGVCDVCRGIKWACKVTSTDNTNDG